MEMKGNVMQCDIYIYIIYLCMRYRFYRCTPREMGNGFPPIHGMIPKGSVEKADISDASHDAMNVGSLKHSTNIETNMFHASLT